MPYVVEPMQIEDVDEVVEIEREAFNLPWPAHAYRRELRENRLSRYVVVKWVEPAGNQTPAQESSRAPAEPRREGAARRPPSGVRRVVEQVLKPFGWAESTTAQLSGHLMGYAGMWLMLDEAHITTIGVRRISRGHGLGELLLANLIEQAMEMGALRVTLEVRVSNIVAQNLYRKYAFHEEGIRRRYYSDNGEDALIMTTDRIDSPEYQKRFAELKQALAEKIKRIESTPPEALS